MELVKVSTGRGYRETIIGTDSCLASMSQMEGKELSFRLRVEVDPHHSYALRLNAKECEYLRDYFNKVTNAEGRIVMPDYCNHPGFIS